MFWISELKVLDLKIRGVRFRAGLCFLGGNPCKPWLAFR